MPDPTVIKPSEPPEKHQAPDPTKDFKRDDNDDDFDASKFDRGDNFEIDTDIKPVIPLEKKEESAKEPAKTEEKAPEAEEKTEVSEEKEPAKVEEPEPEKDQEDDSKEPEPKAKDTKKTPAPVPYDRFKQVNDAKRTAEARVAALEAENNARKQGEEKKYDFDASEAKYAELLLDGKTAEAAQLRKEIRAAERAEYETSVRETAKQEANANSAREAVEEVIAVATAKYAAFDPDSDDYNDDAVKDVEAVFQAAVSRGVKPAKAMSDAIAKAVKLYDLDPPKKEEAVETKKGEKKVEPIKKVEEKLALAKKQAPGAATAGNGSTTAGVTALDVEKMSEEEFASLPVATLQRLRGDLAA